MFPQAGSKEDKAVGHLAMQTALKLDQIPQGGGEVVLDDRDDLTIGRRLSEARKAGYPMIVVVGKAVRFFSRKKNICMPAFDWLVDLCFSIDSWYVKAIGIDWRPFQTAKLKFSFLIPVRLFWSSIDFLMKFIVWNSILITLLDFLIELAASSLKIFDFFGFLKKFYGKI